MASFTVNVINIINYEVEIDESKFTQERLDAWCKGIKHDSQFANYSYYSTSLATALRENDNEVFLPNFGFITQVDYNGIPKVWPVKSEGKYGIMREDMFVPGVSVKILQGEIVTTPKDNANGNP